MTQKVGGTDLDEIFNVDSVSDSGKKGWILINPLRGGGETKAD